MDTTAITAGLQTLTSDAQDLSAKQTAKLGTAAAVIAAEQADAQAATAVVGSTSTFVADKAKLKAAIDAAFPDPIVAAPPAARPTV